MLITTYSHISQFICGLEQLSREEIIMLDSLKNLLKIKSLMTLITGGVFAYMAFSGKLQAETVAGIITMVFTFYFTKTDKSGE